MNEDNVTDDVVCVDMIMVFQVDPDFLQTLET